MRIFNKALMFFLVLSGINVSAMRFLNSRMCSVVKMQILCARRISATKISTRNFGSSLAVREKAALHNDKDAGKWQARLVQAQKDLITLKLGFGQERLKLIVDYPCDFKNAIHIYKDGKGDAQLGIDFDLLRKAYRQRFGDLSWCLEKLHSLKDLPNLKQHFPEYTELIDKVTKEQNQINENLEILMGKEDGTPSIKSQAYPIDGFKMLRMKILYDSFDRACGRTSAFVKTTADTQD